MSSLPLLERRAAELGVPLTPRQLDAFERYRHELLAWNERVNLTSITEPDEVERRHFVDSLTCLLALNDLLEECPAATLIDIGTGGGFPGLPLKIARPEIRLTLLDSVRKKTEFLEHLVRALGLCDVTVLTARAEELGQQPQYRERYDAAVSRALAELPVLLELCLPFVRVGGRLVAPRRGDLLAQQAEAERAARELGGVFRAPIPVDLGPGYTGYGLVVVDKAAPTPPRYPRRPGIPAKRPLV